jgi:cell division protein FtsB
VKSILQNKPRIKPMIKKEQIKNKLFFRIVIILPMICVKSILHLKKLKININQDHNNLKEENTKLKKAVRKVNAAIRKVKLGLFFIVCL